MLMPKDTNVAIDSGCASYMSQIHRHWPKRLLFYCCSQLLVKHIDLTNGMTRTLGEKMRQGEPDKCLT